MSGPVRNSRGSILSVLSVASALCLLAGCPRSPRTDDGKGTVAASAAPKPEPRPKPKQPRLAAEAVRAAEWRRQINAAALSRALRAADPRLRWRAARAVGRIGGPRAVALLTAALVDVSAKVRAEAAFGLRSSLLDAPVAADLRVSALDGIRARLVGESVETDPAARRQLIAALGWLGRRDDVSVLTRRLVVDERGGAELDPMLTAWGLLARRHRLRWRQARPLLSALRPLKVADASPSVQRTVAWALAQIVGRPPRRVVRLLEGIAREGVQRDRVDLETLAEARGWAVRVLARLKPQGWLLQRLSDADWQVQVEAARALGRRRRRDAVKLAEALLGTWRAISASHQRLTGPRLHVVLEGLRSLRPHAGVPTAQLAIRELHQLSAGADAAVGYHPAEAHSIDLVNCAAAELVDRSLRRFEYLPICGSARAKTLSRSWRRQAVARAIGAMPRESSWRLTIIRRYLESEDPRVRLAALEGLVELDDRLFELPLRQVIEHGSVAEVATVAALMAAQPERVGRRLASLAADLDKRLAQLNPVLAPAAVCAVIAALSHLDRPLDPRQRRRLTTSRHLAVRRCAAPEATAASAAPLSDAERPLPDLRWAGEAPLPLRAILVTAKGEVELELFADETPVAVAFFARLAAGRAFRGRRFDRVAAGQRVEGGAPSPDAAEGMLGIPCELTPREFVRGSVGFSSAVRDNAKGRFFITLSRQPELDGRFTQFAKVVGGLDVVMRLQQGEPIKDLYIPPAAKR